MGADYVPAALVLTNLRKLCHNCPACILATIRQLKEDPDDPISDEGGFSWKTEREWWLEDYRKSMTPFGYEGDAKFDRAEWDVYRAERFPCPESK